MVATLTGCRGILEMGDNESGSEAEWLLGRADKPLSERRIRQMPGLEHLPVRKDLRGRRHGAQREVHRLMQRRARLFSTTTCSVD
jgi:hypothetical protein